MFFAKSSRDWSDKTRTMTAPSKLFSPASGDLEDGNGVALFAGRRDEQRLAKIIVIRTNDADLKTNKNNTLFITPTRS